MIDLHTHTTFSDGELIPSELVRRAEVLGYTAIGITDHADYTNIEHIICCVSKAKYLEGILDIRILPGVQCDLVIMSRLAWFKSAKVKATSVWVVYPNQPRGAEVGRARRGQGLEGGGSMAFRTSVSRRPTAATGCHRRIGRGRCHRCNRTD